MQALVAKLMHAARNEGALLFVLLIMAAGCWTFIEVADEVTEGDSQHFDEWVLKNLRQAEDPTEPIGPHWLKIAALDATALGGTLILVLMIAVISAFLWLNRMHHAFWLVLAAGFGGQVLSSVLKAAFGRERPSVVPHLAEVQTSSFPSGHSMMSAVVYLTLGALLTRFVEGRALRLYVLGVAVGLTLLVGLSRIYLGVHYPTDVLAGWTAGLVWALLCWLIAQQLQRKGSVEAPAVTQ